MADCSASDSASTRRTGPAGRFARAVVALGGRLSRSFWAGLGAFLFGLGLLGIAVPLLPTTIFWILALLALARAGDGAASRMAGRIRSWPGIGPAAAALVDHGVVARRTKSAALIGMAASAALAIAIGASGLALWAGLGGIALGALWISTRPESVGAVERR